jgi:uncharacterized protein YjgD (DUF1641 family)
MMSEKTNVEGGGVKLKPHTVESMVELIDTFGLIMTFLNDQAIQDLSGMMSQLLKLVNGLTSTDLVDILERGLMDPELDKALANPPRIGLFGLMGALGDEDTKKGVGILLTLVKAIGRASTS